MLRTFAQARMELYEKLEKACLEREDEAILVMWALGPGVHHVNEIESTWRRMFRKSTAKWASAPHDPQATVRDTMNSHQNIFRKMDGGWSLRSDESSEGFVEGYMAPKSAVQ